MQRLPDGTIRFSPRDLISYLEGDFAAWCDRLHAESTGSAELTQLHHGVGLKPDVADEETALAARYGNEHEAAHLTQLIERLPDLIKIARSSETYNAHDATRAAMASGASVVFQGELRSGDWMGIADFLHRIDGESSSLPHHYEPWDTKLARSAKPYYMLQLCAYADMLEAMQLHRPGKFGFVFGDGTETRSALPTSGTTIGA